MIFFRSILNLFFNESILVNRSNLSFNKSDSKFKIDSNIKSLNLILTFNNFKNDKDILITYIVFILPKDIVFKFRLFLLIKLKTFKVR